MSIDARVFAVICREDGSGELRLVDRPGSPPGIAGQKALRFDQAPHEVTALNGLDVWGDSSSLMLGTMLIARRDGYTKITFCDTETFKEAVRKYHQKRSRDA